MIDTIWKKRLTPIETIQSDEILTEGNTCLGCNHSDCFGYDTRRGNHCAILTDTTEDEITVNGILVGYRKCPFYCKATTEERAAFRKWAL